MPASKKMIKSVGERLRALRETAQLSLKDVAGQINIDTSLLGKIERNERQPTKEQIKHIAAFFKIDRQILIKDWLSDQFAYKIMEEEVEIDILKIAEQKVEYLKASKSK